MGMPPTVMRRDADEGLNRGHPHYHIRGCL